MGTDLYNWEDGGGLKHHCPICQTPLSHDKCRTQCLGVHVEWCGRYHTLFRKNWSSRCSACKTTDEQHDKRHREIAELVAKIKKYKAEEEAVALEPMTPRTSMTPVRTPLTAGALKAADGANDETTPRTTKKERKQLKKAAKAMERDKVVTAADICFVASILHPEGEQEDDEECVEGGETAEDIEIRINLKYNNSVCNTKAARHDFIKRDRAMYLEQSVCEVDHLLSALDINGKATGKEGKLVAELATAIRNDLTHYHNELRITARNKGGFWRWADKRAYLELRENGQDWDDHTPTKERSDSIDDLRVAGEAKAAEGKTDEEEKVERNGSVDSSVEAASGSTALTVPSIEASPAKKARKTMTLSIPPKSKEVVEDPGWTQVGKKTMKKPAGKLKLVKNGGLHHLAQTPKGPYGALTEAWTGPVDGDGKALK